MHCKDGRTLELSVVVSVAPGFLSGYTKIVRFVPRYIIVNTLPYSVRLWQDSSIFRPPDSDNTADASSKERKWRFGNDKREKKSLTKVNQYEALFGRETVLDQRKVAPIPGGTRAHPSALYIASLGSSEIVPFNLPDSRGERQIRIGLGGRWNLTASVSADIPGEHTLHVTRAVDLKMTPHVSTRGSPEYEVRIKADEARQFGRELGVWFETDWGNDRKCVVKAVKKDSFAFLETDVHVGDELLLIDGQSVSQMTFGETMAKLRSRILELAESKQEPSSRAFRRSSLRLVGLGRSTNSGAPERPATTLILKFRTVEERLRRVRLKAARANDLNQSATGAGQDVDSPEDDLGTIDEGRTDSSSLQPFFINADLRAIQHSFFLVVREAKQPPYQIQNRSINSTIYYRQKGCDGHRWQFLKPGQSNPYAWEEPLKQKRLLVRVVVGGSKRNKGSRADEDVSALAVLETSRRLIVRDNEKGRSRHSIFTRKVKEEEDVVFSQPTSVRLEEIGFRDYIRYDHVPSEEDESPSEPRYLELEVDVLNSSRVLIVQDVSAKHDLDQLEQHLESLERQCAEERRRKAILLELKNEAEDNDDTTIPDELAKQTHDVMNEFPEETMITSTHQILVEVIEANGLSPDTLAGTCNPYVEVSVQDDNVRRLPLVRKSKKRRTYYVRKTVNPSWKSQTFVFDTPESAVTSTRGHAVKVRIRNFRSIGYHSVLGSSRVEFHSARDQRCLVGWFPLSGRTGRNELENPLSHWGRGSIKLRIQWIYTTDALFDYFILLSDTRMLDLRESLQGMKLQLAAQKDAAAKRREAIDGFKKVRVHDLLSLSRRKLPTGSIRKSGPSQVRGEEPVSQSIEPKNEFLVDPSFQPKRRTHSMSTVNSRLRTASLEEMRAITARREAHSSPLKVQLPSRENIAKLEKLITQKRFDRSHSTQGVMRGLQEKRPTIVSKRGSHGVLAVGSFKSWPAAQALFRNDDIVAEVSGAEIRLRIKKSKRGHRTSTGPEQSSEVDSLSPVAKKLRPPDITPSHMASAIKIGSAAYERARSSFERTASRKVRAALHPGGWIIVRPFTALNLSDAYSGMFVRLRYGPDILVSESVDARVAPNWFDRVSLRQRQESDDKDIDDEYPNDLCFHVAPQKAGGSIQISVMGEKSHARIQSKTEIGLLQLPLGATIAACIDSEERCKPETDPGLPVGASKYVRWFPLLQPSEVVPVEGDLGTSLRPPESEKKSDTAFSEYFAPCIQLGIIWIPDSDDKMTDDVESNRALSRIDRHPSHLTGPRVSKYLIADIDRVSAALIDSQRAFELVSFSMSDTIFRLWTTKAKSRAGISIGWLQVDQQDESAREPVILAPTPTDYVGPVIQMLAVRDNVRSTPEVESFDYIDFSIAEYDLTLEENVLFDLYDFITSVRLRRGFLVRTIQASYLKKGIQRESVLIDDEPRESNDLLKELTTFGEGGSQKRVYIEQLFL